MGPKSSDSSKRDRDSEEADNEDRGRAWSSCQELGEVGRTPEPAEGPGPVAP
jgi:hypothetical protein